MIGAYRYSYGTIAFSSVTNVQYLINAKVPNPSAKGKFIEVTAIATAEDMKDDPEVIGAQVFFGMQGQIFLDKYEWPDFLNAWDNWLALH